MVEKMPSHESKSSVKANAPLAVELNLPVFEARQVEHWPSRMSWSDAMRNFAPARERYMREFDSPENRLRTKNPTRFQLP